MTTDTHILTPHDLAVTGKSVAKLDGMAVFLDGGLPGSTVLARITAHKKRFAEGVVLETLTPSPDARPSFCAYGGICGGCGWTDLSYEAECAWKERHVRETLRRIGKIDCGGAVEYSPLVPSPRPLRYRNKMEFAFGLDEAGLPALGLRKRGSHAIVSIEDCHLHARPLGALLDLARSWLRERNLSVWAGSGGFCRFLVVRSPDYAPGGREQCLVECITAPGTPEEAEAVAALGKILAEKIGVTGFIHSVRKSPANVAYGETIAAAEGETSITEQLGGHVLSAPAGAFFQANTAAADLLYRQVSGYAGENPGVVWDIYCGVGGIGLTLAAEGVTLRGIETAPEAVAFARRNAENVPGDVAFVTGTAEQAFTKLSPFPDLVITDPPRAGMGKELVELLLREKPCRLIAVSCDAASLARDIATLSQVYAVRSVRAFDLFPRTPHVETVALLERRL